MAEALLRLSSLTNTCASQAQRRVGFRQQRIQLNRLVGRCFRNTNSLVCTVRLDAVRSARSRC